MLELCGVLVYCVYEHIFVRLLLCDTGSQSQAPDADDDDDDDGR